MFPDLSFEEPPAPVPRHATPQGVAGWVAHIREQDMPAFGVTVAAVQDVTGDDKASAARLAQVILQDAALTAKVLKLANSVYYNPGRQTVSTISRAIVVLGFDVVAGIALAASLVDALVKGGVRKRVVAEMARSFHAAVQARALAVRRRDGRAEEVFIAALLMRVGAMAFWCFGGDKALELDRALEHSALPAEEVQRQVLGFKLVNLSAGLAREWRLGPLLVGVLERPQRPSPAEQSVLLAQRLAREVQAGWNAPGVAEVIAEMVEFSACDEEVLRSELGVAAGEAARIAAAYGAADVAGLIPQDGMCACGETVEPDPGQVGDPLLQLHILRELSALIAAGGSLNEVLNLTLEGIYRGIGFERVLFALMVPGRNQIAAKAALGRAAESLRRGFVFGVGEGPAGDVLDALMLREQPFCLPGDPPLSRTDSARLRAVTGAEQAVGAPFFAQGRAVGMFYADRARPVLAEDFRGFQHFVQHVSMAFANLGTLSRSA